MRLFVAMDGLPQVEYHSTLSRQSGFLFVMAMLVMIPLVLNMIKQHQLVGTNSSGRCIVRPSCLDIGPTCSLPQPLDGWCPPSVPAPKASSLQVTTAPVSNAPAVEDTCATCVAHTQHYLCLNQRSNKHFCFTVSFRAPGYSCEKCPVK